MALTLIEQVKVTVGDLGQDSILDNDVYEHFLEKHSNNVGLASIDAAKTIMFYLTRMPTRERTGDIEVWKQWAQSYLQALKEFINNAALTSYSPIPYAGGISKSDMLNNDLNFDTIQKRVYRGFSSGQRPYNIFSNDTCDEVTDIYNYGNGNTRLIQD